METIKEQVKLHFGDLKRNNGRTRTVKTDRLYWRLGKRIRTVAKLYHNIDGYYKEEYKTVDYIFQIIKQVIEEVENGENNSNI